MKKIFSTIAALSLAAAGIFSVSCTQNLPDYTGTEGPEIRLMIDSLKADLNRVDNTPIVCVIFSEAGLKQVKVYKHEGEAVKTLLSEVTSFKDPHQYSVKENPSWTESITAVSILATDNADRTVEATMPVTVIPILPAPVITFGVDKIVIDEKNEDPSTVKTVFEVVSSNILSDVKAALFTSEGIVNLPLNPTFKAGSESYRFEQDIDYFEGFRGLQVTATDGNGKMKIETLPINYIAAPAPIVTLSDEKDFGTIFVRSTDSKTFSFHVDAETGLSYIEVLKVTKDIQGKDVEERISIDYYDASKDFKADYTYTAPSFDRASHALRFVVSDRLNHAAKVDVKTVVDMRMGEQIVIATQRNTKEPLVLEGYEGEHYCFFSVKDFKTYSLFDFWRTDFRRNIDFFYFAWNNGGAADNGTRIMKASEDRAGQDPSWYQYVDPQGENSIPLLSASTAAWSGRNATFIKRLTTAYAFDFDNVTVSDLLSAPVQTYLAQGKVNTDWFPYKAGECFLFKTGSASTCPNCTGVVRVEEVVGSRDSFIGQNTPPNDKPAYIVISIKAQILD